MSTLWTLIAGVLVLGAILGFVAWEFPTTRLPLTRAGKRTLQLLGNLFKWTGKQLQHEGKAAFVTFPKWAFKKMQQRLHQPDDQPPVPSPGVQGHPGQYRLYQLLAIATYVVMAGTGLAFWNASFTPLGPDLNVGPGMFGAIVLHLVASLRKVAAEQVAGAFTYGKALKRLQSGWHFVPRGLVQIEWDSRQIKDDQFPAAPEKVYRRDDGLPIREDQVQPIRIVTGGPAAVSADDPDQILNAQMTLEVSFVIQWKITDMLNFVSNYGSVEEVRKQLRDVGEATLAEDFSQKTPKAIIKTLPEINKKLVDEVSKRFLHAGFELVSARLVSPDLSHGVSSELANIPAERAKASQTRIKAEAERDKRTQEGLGAANAKEAGFDADAKGYEKIKQALGVTGDKVLNAEVAKAAAQNAKVVVAGAKGGMADLLGMALGGKEVLDSTKEEEKV